MIFGSNEGYDDIRFKDLGKLNIYFEYGIDIDPNEYDMLAYEDGYNKLLTKNLMMLMNI
jgi:hypothetical protein